MDTSEGSATTPAETLYDGFISYSHAADGLLAPRLQAGLQRFAKPWWKRRAVRIFRDESSLSANPHLGSSITRGPRLLSLVRAAVEPRRSGVAVGKPGDRILEDPPGAIPDPPRAHRRHIRMDRR